MGEKLFDEVSRHLKSQGLTLREGSIVGATIISVPTSAKNKAGERDPEQIAPAPPEIAQRVPAAPVPLGLKSVLYLNLSN